MDWEEFLILQSYYRQKVLTPTARDFFVRYFADETSLDLSVDELAKKYCIEFKTCARYRTAIFKAFGASEGEQHNNKFRPLYQRLRREYEQRVQREQARSCIPLLRIERFHQLLQSLNYQVQEHTFRQMQHPAIAFLVRIEDFRMKQWLVWRLVEQLRQQLGDTEKPRCLVVKTQSQWAAQPELFWEWLAAELQADSSNQADVLDAIVQACQTRSHVFVIHGFDVLKPVVQHMLIHDFWQPVMQLLGQRTKLGFGKCRLLLTADCDEPDRYPELITSLTPWQTVDAEKEMRPWLEQRPVREFLGGTPEELEQMWLATQPLGTPIKVIKKIGEAVDLTDVIDELQSYWQLTA